MAEIIQTIEHALTDAAERSRDADFILLSRLLDVQRTSITLRKQLERLTNTPSDRLKSDQLNLQITQLTEYIRQTDIMIENILSTRQ